MIDNRKELKIIVAHPGKQHSYKTATALEQSGFLFKFITTTYNKKGSLTNFLFNIAKGNTKKKIGSHYCKDLPDDKVMLCCEFLGNFALIINKIPGLKKLYVKWNNYLNDCFGKKVAEYAIKNNIDAVISYDYNSAILFEELKRKAPNIICILDVSIATRPFMREVFQKDIDYTGIQEIKTKYPEIWNDSNLKRAEREIKKADFFLAASQVVKRSLIFCGVSENKIHILPYGVDCKQFNVIKEKVYQKPLKLIFVGGVDYRKGIHHLLKVVADFGDDIDLTLVGAYDAKGKIYLDYHRYNNIHFMGFITRELLAKYYQESDVFVFPSLGEGFALVVLEALSCGLPVIVSDLAGGNDAITNGIDGFEFEAGNDVQLKERIKWFIDHPEYLSEMRVHSRKKAEQYTWEVYYKNLYNIITNIL